MGVNTQQNDYYESLFRRTTASYRAKIERGNEENQGTAKRKSVNSEKPTSSRQANVANRKILGERNHGETSSTSNDVLENSPIPARGHYSKGPAENYKAEINADKGSIKTLIEDTLKQILHDKYSQQPIVNENCQEKTTVKSIVEQVLREKLSNLRHTSRERHNTSEPGSLRSIIEDIVAQVLQEKLSNLERKFEQSKDPCEVVKNLNQELQQKLNVSKDQTVNLAREPVTHYNSNKSLDSQVLVQELLADERADKKETENKKKSTTTKTGPIKRLHRSPRKKPEWQDPRPNDIILDKPQRPLRARSPAASSSARSGRSKASSSVLIRRSTSQGRQHKPNSDPVALYQYYKNEWDHFRQQIPGESPHSRLRWHVRQRLLDPE
ncbi:hypothetical protein FF38_05811 [Lucilia cuprina]|uniref:Centriolar and ciliogenesis-associated protein HYLS1 C-terminal domain-containing protein n=1 Tax=Lucilia cuprina TaxID=7375 RepID=A0A0L0CMR2_LUCCU|nr:hypothetical protein FF38_05811 [Lucilia cuprina]